MLSIGNAQCKSAQVSAVIIRADGSKEDLGVISYYHTNPFKRMMFNIKKFFNLKGK